MKRSLWIIFTISLVGTTSAAIIISADKIDADISEFTTSTGKYSLHSENVSWDEARRRCENMGSKLVEIESKNELREIEAELSISRYLNSAWTGGRGAQPGEFPRCAFFWNLRGTEVALSVAELDGDECYPGNMRQFLRVEIISCGGLKARHNKSILPYICERL